MYICIYLYMQYKKVEHRYGKLEHRLFHLVNLRKFFLQIKSEMETFNFIHEVLVHTYF